jgi:flagellar basal body-associated protein FliL
MDWGFIGIIVIVVIVVLVLFAAFRMFGKRPGRHVMRKNEI